MWGDKLWTTVDYYESVSDGIRVDSFNLNSEVVLLGLSDYSKLGLSNIQMLVVADSSKLIKELDCKEFEKLGVF